MGVDILSLSARLAASANLDSHLFTVALYDHHHRKHDPKRGSIPKLKRHDFVRILSPTRFNPCVKF
jgi:ribosome biogenesis protein Tsr3